jgi:hypothetical protein
MAAPVPKIMDDFFISCGAFSLDTHIMGIFLQTNRTIQLIKYKKEYMD